MSISKLQYWKKLSPYYNKENIDNRLKNVGLPIGTIFPYVSNTPPEGAFLLNGQIIYNCSTLYPQFYTWINNQISLNNIRSISNSIFESELSNTGNCGAFVIDTENGSVRLPSITTGFIQGSNSNIGNSEEAGLPNITGSFNGDKHDNGNGLVWHNETSGAFEIYSEEDHQDDPSTSVFSPDSTTTTHTHAVFDASKSNSIYGNSNTVQPNAVHYPFCIQVYTISTEISQQNSSYLTSELQSKAGINLENLTANGKNIISNVAVELDYENRIENLVENTLYLAATNGILSSYATYGNSRTVFYLQTVPPITSTEEDGYFGYRIGAYLSSETPAIGYNLFVPKGWFYSIVTRNGTFVQQAKFIPFKNS